MAKFIVLCLILTFVSIAMADNASNFANSPASSPSSSIRKLGMHHLKEEKSINFPKEVIGSPHQQEDNEVDQDHDEIKMKHHHSVDKSIFGGGVILGGLATTFFVAIFCYIRATRRKSNVEPSSPSSSSAV
ncbi:uncharacterized protein LOC132057931 [Lycium ferocissimum]|uniref:uncharacterized protein LOC132057931 n=1 Tax=Lycium ferocissimum TaxID=112874 RepID=UPI002814F033|nr:uncharacterized protein LOC132057931 [Lycium ferocissimum]